MTHGKGGATNQDTAPDHQETNEAGRTHSTGADAAGEGGRDDIRLYLDAVFGDGNGFAVFALGMSPRRNPKTGKYEHEYWSERDGEKIAFSWPEQAEQICEAIEQYGHGGDLYVAPYLRRSKARAKGDAVILRLVHTDGDNGLDPEKIATLVELGAFVVASGSPGNGHVYVPQDRELSQAEHEALCKGLIAYLDGDKAKHSDNDLLRPVGAYNLKSTVFENLPAHRVHWLIKPNGKTGDPHTLAALLGVDLDAVGKAKTNGQGKARSSPYGDRAEAEPFDLDKYPKVRAALNREGHDRSTHTFGVMAECYRAGLRFAQACWAVYQRPRLAERLVKRPEDDEVDLERVWRRVIDDEQRQRQERAEGQDADAEGDDLFVDIAAALAGGMPEAPKPSLLTRTDGVVLFYRGEVNLVFGDPEHGKTWVALAACAENLENGKTIVYIDLDHNGWAAIRERLIALGAPQDRVDDRNWCRIYEGKEPTAAEIDKVVAAVIKRSPDTVVVDSTGELLPLFGASSDSSDDFTKVHNRVLQPMANTDATVIVNDHLAKSTESRKFGPGGGMAKRRTVGGVSLRVVRERPYTKKDGGASKLWVNKDRHGGVREYCDPPRPGKDEQLAGRFILEPVNDGMSKWRIEPPDSSEKFRPTVLMERVSRTMEGEPGMTRNKVAEHTTGQKAAVLTAIDVLVEEGYAYIKTPEDSKYPQYFINTPYREDDDTAGDGDVC